MGLSLLPKITDQLLARGMPPRTPFAVVAKATQVDQQVVTGTLADIADNCAVRYIPSPALLIMGECVGQIRQDPRIIVDCQARLLANA
jgi:siroheme synthase